jgi:hypothetical protein
LKAKLAVVDDDPEMLALLALVPLCPGARLGPLVAVVVLASVGAHMPRRLRHYSVLERRVVSHDETPAWR